MRTDQGTELPTCSVRGQIKGLNYLLAVYEDRSRDQITYLQCMWTQQGTEFPTCSIWGRSKGQNFLLAVYEDRSRDRLTYLQCMRTDQGTVLPNLQCMRTDQGTVLPNLQCMRTDQGTGLPTCSVWGQIKGPCYLTCSVWGEIKGPNYLLAVYEDRLRDRITYLQCMMTEHGTVLSTCSEWVQDQGPSAYVASPSVCSPVKYPPAVNEYRAGDRQHMLLHPPYAVQEETCICSLVTESHHLKVLHSPLLQHPFLWWNNVCCKSVNMFLEVPWWHEVTISVYM